jgi:hypothetical protein
MKRTPPRSRAAAVRAPACACTHDQACAPSRTFALAEARTIDRRPLRLVASGLTLLTITAVLMLLLATSARASEAVWVVPANVRVFPATTPGTVQKINVNAARNEYQGFQVALRGGGSGLHDVTFSWSSDTPQWIQDNTVLDRIYYVKVTTPTSYLHAKAGWYPDPLVPRSFGQANAVPSNTQAFYLLTYVPPDALAGDYSGKLHIVNGSTTIDLPFTLHVWNFTVKISAGSSFSVSAKGVKRSILNNSSGVAFSGQNERKIMNAFVKVMQQHGISPSMPQVWPRVTSTGDLNASPYVTDVSPLLNNDGLNLHDTQIPWALWFPWSRGGYSPSSARLANYLTQIFHVYAQQGWQKKAYTYLLDETTAHSEELLAERYARLVHRASAASGFRMRYLLTDDPRPFALGRKPANKFLFDDVDIWGVRYYYFFGRVPAIRDRQKHGQKVWWYTYTNAAVGRNPSFVIEKPPNDSRVRGWLMVKWNVQGVLNWGFNRWGIATTGSGWRDPYLNPLSLVRGKLRSNGDTCLVYPGYYPRLGLNDPFAPPCSSLRLEALRDGLEEREYLLSAQREAGGPAFVKSVLSKITWGPDRIRQANVFVFPGYTKSEGVFDSARGALARFIEASQP